MGRALDEIELMKGDSNLLKLFRAEIFLGQGNPSKAALLLDECRDEILKERPGKKGDLLLLPVPAFKGAAGRVPEGIPDPSHEKVSGRRQTALLAFFAAGKAG